MADKICGSIDPHLAAADEQQPTKKKTLMLTSDQLHVFQQVYSELHGQLFEKSDIDPLVKTVNGVYRFDETTQKNVFFSTVDNQTSSRSCDSIVFLRKEQLFGQIVKIMEHHFLDRKMTWVLVNVYPPPTRSGNFWLTDNKTVSAKLLLFQNINNPLVTATTNDNKLWFINHVNV